MKNAENTGYLYFPLAGEKGLKSSVTPNLCGDAMIDQETFLLEPVSVENLHNNKNTRNFWVFMENGGAWSVAGSSARQESCRFTMRQDQNSICAGLMWHTVKRYSQEYELCSRVTSFIPVDENVEIMSVMIQNEAPYPQTIVPTAVIPIYGRSADNLRDHRNVTAMLHRIKTISSGVLVKPTMSFDEKGHRENNKIYYVLGFCGNGAEPESFYPTIADMIGEGGSFASPRAIFRQEPGVPAGRTVSGREAVGGLRFPCVTLNKGECLYYTILSGVAENEEEVLRVGERFRTKEMTEEIFSKTKQYWNEKVNVRFHTGNQEFDRWMVWTAFQPYLRRLFGCSFLPYHDYGRGGRGWRDLWQDCLSLLFMEPANVRRMILSNFRGVRIDGTNATIIGSREGEFIADRNGILRVWMDHAFWPQQTLLLYLDQSGDYRILSEEVSCFKDSCVLRGTKRAALQTAEDPVLRTLFGEVYSGSVIEHLLVENLCAIYEVGVNNTLRLRGADWNDALDMAAERGESVAFTFAYAGNLRQLARMLENYQEKTGITRIAVLKELMTLIETDPEKFDSVEEKLQILEAYCRSCEQTVSGERVFVEIDALAKKLDAFSLKMSAHLNQQEWIDGEEGEGWFNSYYDNDCKAVERYNLDPGQVRMMLTGQVFAIMSGVAPKDRIQKITKAADHYLYREEIGGYRLNTDFHELKFNLGHMFGFAYGEKENGSVFSHMAVMYANSLYRRGFAREGHKVLDALSSLALKKDIITRSGTESS